MNILLIYLQPKDIPEVTGPLEQIPVDKLILKYFPYPDVYYAANTFLIDHSEYTHIVWLQNDIILTEKDFRKMVEKVYDNHYRILGLSMNVDLTGLGRNLDAYTTKPFNIHNWNKVNWAKKGEHTGIIPVFHNGGPFIMERVLFLQYPLHGDLDTGFNADMHQGSELFQDDIVYNLDSEANLKHLRYVGQMQVNKKKPVSEYYRHD